MVEMNRRGVLGGTMAAIAASLFPVQKAHATPNPNYASIVYDPQSGEVLRGRSHNALRRPASLTKMMTMLLAFRALERGTDYQGNPVTLDTPLIVSANARAEPPSKLGFDEGETISMHAAMGALGVKSANDVATAVAETLAGDEDSFVALMNETAAELGMTNTAYRNAHGLDARGQMTTALDQARLLTHIMQTYPQYREYLGAREFNLSIESADGEGSREDRTLRTHNRLIFCGFGQHGKTGYTRSAGYTMAIQFDEINGQPYVVVVLGARQSRARDRDVLRILNDVLDDAFDINPRGHAQSVCRIMAP